MKVHVHDADQPPAADHLHETPLARDQKIRELSDGWVRVTANVNDAPELRWWLLAFGDAVEVRRPGALRMEIAGALRAAAAMYRT